MQASANISTWSACMSLSSAKPSSGPHTCELLKVLKIKLLYFYLFINSKASFSKQNAQVFSQLQIQLKIKQFPRFFINFFKNKFLQITHGWNRLSPFSSWQIPFLKMSKVCYLLQRHAIYLTPASSYHLQIVGDPGPLFSIVFLSITILQSTPLLAQKASHQLFANCLCESFYCCISQQTWRRF